MKRRAALSAAQQEVMDVIWEVGEATVSDVRQTLAGQNREVARNTVLTMMQRMEEKGWLVHRQSGNTYIYRPAIPRNASRAQKVGDILESMFDGAADELVTSLLEYRGLTSDEADRIRRLLDDADQSQNKSRQQGNGSD